MDKYKSGKCSICENMFSLLHWHHTVPQALGGKDSLQIPLCSDCHNVLHAHGEAIVAKIRSGKPITRHYWRTTRMAENAQKYLGILVDAILDPPVLPQDKGYKLQLEVPASVHSSLHLLKQDLDGVTTLQGAVLYCIAETLKHKGFTNGNAEKHRSEGHRVIKRTTPDLW